MATVRHNLVNPGGQPIVDAYVEVRLLAPTDTSVAYLFDGTGIADRWVTRTDEDGEWEVEEITPNDEIDPSGTVYSVLQRPQGGSSYLAYFEVPTAATPIFDLRDLLTEPPTSIASAALQSHLDESDLHGPYTISSFINTAGASVGDYLRVVDVDDDIVAVAAQDGDSDFATSPGNTDASPTADMSTGSNWWSYTLNTNATFTFTGAEAAPVVNTLSIFITGGAGTTITWPVSVSWILGTGEAPASGVKRLYNFVSIDGGVTWLGFDVKGAIT